MTASAPLQGQVAVVTGGASGIGRAVVELFAEAGLAGLAVIDVAECDLSGLDAELVTGRFDVADADAVGGFVSDVHDRFGRIDILVNNAGIIDDGLLVRMSDDAWNRVIATNLNGTFYCTRAALRGMMRNRWGRIIHIGSVVGIRGNVGQANYSASKAAIIGFTKSLAKEVATRGITVNAVTPGYINTDTVEGLQQEQKDRIMTWIPMGHFGEVEDIAHLVGHVAGTKSSYVTGQVLAMVGGRDFFGTDDDAKVNLAVGAGRQVGSSMKTIGMAAALEAGWKVTATYPAPNVLEFEIPGADDDNKVWRVTGGVGGHDATEARFEHGIQALLQFYLREEHTDVPPDHVETIRIVKEVKAKDREAGAGDGDGTEITYQAVDLTQWVANRRYDFDRERLFRDRVHALETIPTWSWEPPEGEELVAPPDAEEVTLIRALRSSLNTVFAQLSMEMGSHRVVSMARRLGIRSTIQRVNSNILGTSNTTMLDMVTAYHTLANRGVTIAPSYVTRIARSDGTTLWSWTRQQSRVLDARLADQVTWILEGAVSQGTGWRAQLEDRPSAGKTGTTQNYADAVFVGYTPQRTTAVWVGYPEAQIPMIPPTTARKVYGGTYPAMIWKDVMEAAHLGLPVEEFASIIPTRSVLPTPATPTTTVAVEVPDDGRIPTPDLLGLTLQNARALLAGSVGGIRIVSIVEVEMEGTEPGTIIGQAPAVGSWIQPGGSLLLEVTVEPPPMSPVVVPEVVERPLATVMPLLESLGLGYQVIRVADPDEPDWISDLVWSQDPAAGTVVEPGTVMTLRVAP